MSDKPATLPYIVWRKGRPRFVPGARERALGFKGRDLRHEDGRWFSLEEAETFARSNRDEIVSKKKMLKRPPVKKKPADPDALGFVYFMRCGKWLKIGFSKNPINRAAHLITKQPHPLTALIIVPGTHRDERRAHKALRRYRLNGEWFNFSSEAEALIWRCAAAGYVLTSTKFEQMSHAAGPGWSQMSHGSGIVHGV